MCIQWLKGFPCLYLLMTLLHPNSFGTFSMGYITTWQLTFSSSCLLESFQRVLSVSLSSCPLIAMMGTLGPFLYSKMLKKCFLTFRICFLHNRDHFPNYCFNLWKQFITLFLLHCNITSSEANPTKYEPLKYFGMTTANTSI